MKIGVNHTHVTYVPELNEGISKNIHHLVETLARRGVRARLAAPTVTISELNQKSTYVRKAIECVGKLKGGFDDADVDLIHYHLSLPTMGVLARLARVRARARKPIIAHAWNPFVTRRDAARGGFVESAYHFAFNNRPFASYAIRHFDALIVSSRYQEAQARVNGYRGPVHVIANGVDAFAYRPARSAREKWAARETLGLARDAPTILYYGHLTPWKGAHVFVDAMLKVGRAFPDARFVIAHTPYGSAARVLRSRLTSLGIAGRVHWIGNTDVPTLLRAVDIGVVPMVGAVGTACHPNVLLEYLAAGVPVVASRCGSIPEVIKHEENGLLAEPGDSEDLAAKLVSLLASSEARARMSVTARADALERFDWADVARRVATVYEDVLDGARPVDGDIPELTVSPR